MTTDFEAREQRILDAAMALVTRYGYDKTSVSEIADEAGVSKGAIYLHFDSKDDLFERLMLREMRRYAEDWLARVEADPQGGTMGAIYRHILSAIHANPFIQAVFDRDRRILGKYMNRVEQLFEMRRIIDMRAEFVRKMQAAGVVRQDVDPHTTAYLMSVFVSGITTMDKMLPAEVVPPFDDLLTAMGNMMDGYLSQNVQANPEAGKQIIRETMAEARRHVQEAENRSSEIGTSEV